MQILKESVRRNILSAARDEFEEKGFHRASMRVIAEHAGMTAGNLYHYFKHKEALFEAIVAPVYKSIKEFIRDNGEGYFSGERGRKGYLNGINKKIVESFFAYRTEILILFDGSEGTKYAHAYEEYRSLIQRQLRQGLSNRSAELESTSKRDFIIRRAADYYIEGVLAIMREVKTEKKFRVFLDTLLEYHLYGIRGFLD